MTIPNPFANLSAEELAQVATEDPNAIIEAPLANTQAVAQLAAHDSISGVLPASNFMRMGEALKAAKPIIMQTDTYMIFDKVGDTKRAILLGMKTGINAQKKTFPLAKFLTQEDDGSWKQWVHGGVTLIKALEGVKNGSMVEITLVEQKKNDKGGKTNIFSVALLASPDGSMVAGQEPPKQVALWDINRVSQAKTWLESLTVSDGIVYDGDGVADPKLPAKIAKALDSICSGLRIYAQDEVANAIEKAHGNQERLSELMRGVLVLEGILTPGADDIPF